MQIETEADILRVMDIKRLYQRVSPLCYFPDDRLACYRRGEIVVMRGGKEESAVSISISTKERLFGCSRLATRLLRLGIREAIALDNQSILLSRDNVIQELNIKTGDLSKGWLCGEGVRPLVFSDVKNIDGFVDGFYFGGYLGNMDKKPVHIYRRVSKDNWQVAYTFDYGEINHVHNIVSDPYRNCLWIFTGDFGNAAAIWKVSDNFKKVKLVVCNNQKYRACAVFARPEGLLYATDAPFMEDSICLMNPNTFEVKELFPIHGSCIYGCQWKDEYVFSSTVEGDGRNMSRWDFLFTRKRGAGIKDNYVHMYLGNPQAGFKEIYKEKKDCLPFYPFQFGVFKFPVGVNNTDSLLFQPIATTNDGKLIRLK